MQKESFWQQAEFKDRIVVNENERLSDNQISAFSKQLNETQKLNIKIAAKKYNSEEKDWTLLPLRLSKPIYSKERDFAIIEFIFGNNGGETSLYHLENNRWEFMGNLTRWEY
jgi:hypothetical protein